MFNFSKIVTVVFVFVRYSSPAQHKFLFVFHVVLATNDLMYVCMCVTDKERE